MQGVHLTADLYQCAGAPGLMRHAETIARLCRRQTRQAGLRLLDERWVSFPDRQGQPGGVTGALLLAESHLAIHTWPESGHVTLDVYVCNFSIDNSGKAQALMDGLVRAYAPRRARRGRLLRGDIGPGAPENTVAESEDQGESGGWATQALGPHARFGVHTTARWQGQTRHQRLELLETPAFGRVLCLDGRPITSEREGFFHHEALVHPAAVAHAAPRRGLILGGGDGGAAAELLKHPSLECVVLAEPDEQVLALARERLRTVRRNVWDDPRLRLWPGDNLAFFDTTPERFDLVLLASADPGTPAGALHAPGALQRLRRVLMPGGALALHLGSPVFHAPRVRRLVRMLRGLFPQVACYGLYVPLYGTYWGMAVCSDTLDAAALDATEAARRLAQRGVAGLRYYNPQVHSALFALPNYYRELVAA